jgi:hypothetical protein
VNKDQHLVLSYVEVRHLIDTLADCQEEFETLMRDEEWFVTEVVDRIETALEILNTQRFIDDGR